MKRVMILGAGELGKELAKSFQKFGCYIISIDSYPTAPGFSVSHEHYVIDMLLKKDLKEVIYQCKPDLIVSEIEAISTEALIEIEKEKFCKVYPNASAIQTTMDRKQIRILAAHDLELPTSKFAFINFDENSIENNTEEDLDEFFKKVVNDNDIGYPCFVKPVMSSSGKGQSRVENPDQLLTAIKHAVEFGRGKKRSVIIESFIDFDYEITLLTVRYKHITGKDKIEFCDPIGHIQENGDYRISWQPQPMSIKALAKSRIIAEKIVNALGGYGIFGVELFVKGDDVWFSEVSPRPHDTGLVTLKTQYFSEFNLHVRAILGMSVQPDLRNKGLSHVILAESDSTDFEFTGIDAALNLAPNDSKCEILMFGKKEARKNRRMGVLLYNDQSLIPPELNSHKYCINTLKDMVEQIKQVNS